MFAWLPLLFIAVPMVELWLLIKIGSVIGAGWTIVGVVGTGVAGAWLARREGTKTLQQWMHLSAQGVLPGQAIFDGMAIFLGGALLLTPGLVTDVVGFLLLIPISRALIQSILMARLKARLSMQQVVIDPAGFGPRPTSGSASGTPYRGPNWDPNRNPNQGPERGGQTVVDQTFDEEPSTTKKSARHRSED